jgi:chorismate dehydratase
MKMKTDSFVFAGAAYSNSAPLMDLLPEVDDCVRVIYDHPAHLVADLQCGRCDAALVPVAHFFAHDDLQMIQGLGVAAQGAVRSVLLKCDVPVEQVRKVGRDPASASSNALADLLLRRYFGLEVELVDLETGGGVDASVVIGDRALLADPAPCGDIDLAEVWARMTGLPFVFAVWAVRTDHPHFSALSRIAHAAYRAAQGRLDRIAQRYASEQGQTSAFWLDYLQRSIRYEIGEQELEGMRLFGRYLSRTD